MADGGDEYSDTRWGAVALAMRTRMAELKVTQKKLAADADVAIATLNELLAGTVRRRHPHTLAAISEALGWPADQILRMSRGDSAALARTEHLPDVDEEITAIREELRRINERLDALESTEPEDAS